MSTTIFQKVSEAFRPVREHILIIEDEKSAQKFFSDFLGKRGYRITSAMDLAEAKAKLSCEKYDLILLDVLLPDGDGIEFLPTIKTLLPKVPVIILTGIGYEESALQLAFKNGASAYVSKLQPGDQLVMEIHRVMAISDTPFT